MMKRLSLSQAWDETRMVLVRDGRLLASVALALVVLPQTIIGLVTPASGGQPTTVTALLLLVTALIGLVAQIAMNRLAVGPSTTVGAAITRGLARMPIVFLSLIFVFIVMFVVLIPIVLGLGVAGLISEPLVGHEAPLGVVLLMVLIAAMFYALFQLTIPISAAEDGGPIRLLMRSIRLGSRSYLRLLAFAILIVVSLVIVIIAGQFGIGSMIEAALGPPVVLSMSALLISLVVALIQAVFTVVFAVMLARIYVQLAEGEAQASVPSTGT